MLIQVIFVDGSQLRIHSEKLSHLLREGRIRAFRRSSGWVHVGKDPIRKYDHVGKERMSVYHTHEKDLLQLKEAYP